MENRGDKVWLVTGAASGLGYQFVQAILERGDKVIATSRARSIPQIQHLVSERCHVMELDVAQENEKLSVAKAEEAIAKWGRVDVLVNNAGYAYKPFPL